MKLTYLSHAFFAIETNGHKILIDPFIDGNRLCPVKSSDLKADYVIVTHAHGDHWGNTMDFALAGATVIAAHEIVNYAERNGAKNLFPMNVGGAAKFPFGRVKFMPAFHSSGFPDGSYGGAAMSLVLDIEGFKIYHAGDTALFSDMRLVGDMGIDLAMLPIGDTYTMGAADALEALALLRPKTVIPMHYDTFDVIQADPYAFAAKAEAQGIRSLVMKPLEILELEAAKAPVVSI